MTTENKALAVLAVVQIALVLVTWRPGMGGHSEATVDLLGLPTDQITKISITGRAAREEAPEKPVVLSKSDKGWVLDSSEGYPATDANMKTVLDDLEKLHKVSSPVAHRSEDYQLLEVADDKYTRKVEVSTADGKSATLFLGAAQGQASHVRAAGGADVYDVAGFSAWSLAEHDNRYFDRDFLKVDPKNVQAATLERPGQPPIVFTNTGDTWSVSPSPEGKEADQDATRTFVQAMLSIRMLEPAGKEAKPDMGLDHGTKLTWVQVDPDNGGASTTQTLVVGDAVSGENGRLWVKSTTSPYVVKVLKGSVTQIMEKPIDALFSSATIDIDAPPAP